MIRAVKYAAASDFKLPIPVRWKIKKHSSLLGTVSPSRLTEEIFKIINSPHSAAIVEGLDALGLYRYLQPGAAELFKTRSLFRARYLKTLAELNQESSRIKMLPGEAMSTLIRDYLEDEASWTAPGISEEPHALAELYKDAFILARKFVLPMNPPRAELDNALRLLFARHGIAIKKTRHHERPPRFCHQGATVKVEESKESTPVKVLPITPEPDGADRKPPCRRRRRVKSKE